MNGLIVYRSYFGNTKHVAELLAEELAGNGQEAEVRSIAEAPRNLSGFGFIAVGSPTRYDFLRGRGGANGSVRRWLRSVRRSGFEPSHTVIVFDTCAHRPVEAAAAEKAKRFLEPGAAGILAEIAQRSGLSVFPKALRCEVAGTKGPLGDGEEVKARAFARELSRALRA